MISCLLSIFLFLLFLIKDRDAQAGGRFSAPETKIMYLPPFCLGVHHSPSFTLAPGFFLYICGDVVVFWGWRCGGISAGGDVVMFWGWRCGGILGMEMCYFGNVGNRGRTERHRQRWMADIGTDKRGLVSRTYFYPTEKPC